MTALEACLAVSGSAITSVTPPGGGWLVSPGLVDLQVNGGWGHDFTSDPGSIWEVGRHLSSVGVTSFLPTIVSAPYAVVDAALSVLADGPPAGYLGAEPLGLHVEGPWISPEWPGAHDPVHLKLPDLAVARRWAESGLVRMVTIAPELEGAFAAAEILASSGVVVSVGHSGADFDTASSALAGSWSAVTHLFNQMSPFHHRSPGLVGAALLSDRPCGVIADGIHVHPAALELAWRHLGPERLVLVTDAMAASGLGPGSYPLGDHIVEVDENGPRLSSGALAGSAIALSEAVANVVEWTDATSEQALAAASATPARLLGIDDRGALEPGMRADAVLWDERLQVRETMIRGLTPRPGGRK